VTDWAAVVADDFAVPAGRPLADLMAEACDMLASPDPAIRDDTAYPVLALWTARGVLDEHVTALGDRMADTLRHAEIQARTFAAMILGWVVLRDARTGAVPAGRVLRWRDTFAAWWSGETDLRGWDADLGWLHAVAHGADTVRAFGRSPRLGGSDLGGLLDLAVDRLLVDAGYLFAHGEDDRLAYALATVLSRPEVEAGPATAWLDRLDAALRAGEPGPFPAWVSNTNRTLAALYMFADRGVRWYDPETGTPGATATLPHSPAITDAIAAVLRPTWYGLA
jgi:hypothetical protein